MQNTITKYRELLPEYETFASRIKSLLLDMLNDLNTKVHFAESRAKSVDSFTKKLNRPGKSFEKPLDEIPDLAGVRIVLYYLDDIQHVGDMIKREFEIIEEVTEHQADHYSPDQFGYLSMHYVVKLNTVRGALKEWKNFTTFRAEIQVRTVLQHSWAAVSHALQYNREGDVPHRLRRQLFRLAGLLELADEEFVAIRDTKERITTTTQATSEQELKKAALDAPIIWKWMKTSSQLVDARSLMMSIGYVFEYEDPAAGDDFVGTVVEECERLNIPTVDELETALNYDKERFLKGVFKEGWQVDGSFSVYLLLIGAFPDSFSLEHLVGGQWDKDSAATLIENIKSLSAKK